MKLLKMQRPECMVYSAAMLLDVTPQVIKDNLKGDPLEVVWPSLLKPACFRGVHIDELNYLTLKLGKGVFVPFAANPRLRPFGHDKEDVYPVYSYDQRRNNLLKLLKTYNAMLIGLFDGRPHAVAWDKLSRLVYDPNGIKRDLTLSDVVMAYILYE